MTNHDEPIQNCIYSPLTTSRNRENSSVDFEKRHDSRDITKDGFHDGSVRNKGLRVIQSLNRGELKININQSITTNILKRDLSWMR